MRIVDTKLKCGHKVNAKTRILCTQSENVYTNLKRIKLWTQSEKKLIMWTQSEGLIVHIVDTKLKCGHKNARKTAKNRHFYIVWPKTHFF